MGFDVAQLRNHFPSLASGVAHFDGPGGTQTPRQVGEAIAATLTGPLSNRGEGVVSAVNASRAVAEFRHAYADLLGATPEGIVHGRSATALAYDFSRTLAKTWSAGEEIVVSRLDHDSNIRPWLQVAERVGVRVRWIDFDPATGELDRDSLAEALSERTRLVAITAASNLIGTKPDVASLAEAAHAVGALVYVDGVHFTAHDLVDVAELGADLFTCSPYKFLGPHCGVLAGDPALLETLRPDKLVPSPDRVPERFELGTLPYETLAGATAAVDFLAGIAPGGATDRRAALRSGFEAIEAHEHRLLARLSEGIGRLGDAVTVHSRAASRTPTMLLTFPGRRSADAAALLAERAVFAPAGTFYAYEPFRRLGLSDDAALRVGLAPYVDESDVDRLLEGLAEFVG